MHAISAALHRVCVCQRHSVERNKKGIIEGIIVIEIDSNVGSSDQISRTVSVISCHPKMVREDGTELGQANAKQFF